ncbi:MAG: hypothetical protein DHS20C15_28370 [Planctomycetota bacterium]|nr:MAG: hypothetical protein DHS20C15_28370 [Planctomycetota bacterium]
MSPWQRNVGAVWLNNFITSAGMMCFLPLFPFYLRDLGIHDEASVRIWNGVLVAAAPLTAAFMGPVWGALGDRLGRKPMMLRANLAIVVFVGLMGSVNSVWWLLALRLCQGVFSGFIAPAMTLVSVATPENRQARVTSWLQTATMAGGAMGPWLGGRLASAQGMRSVFWACAGASLLAALLTSVLVREPQAFGGGEARQRGSVSPGEMLRGVVRDIAGFLRSPALRGILFAVFAVRFGGALVEPNVGLWVETLPGIDPSAVKSATGDAFAVFTLALLVGAPVWGSVGDRLGHRKLFTLCAVGAAAFQLLPLFVDDYSAFLALRFGAGFFVAAHVPAAFAAAAKHSSVTQRGGAYGVTFSSVILARALAPLCAGVLAAGLGLEILFVLSAVLMLGAGLVVGRRRRGVPVETASAG